MVTRQSNYIYYVSVYIYMYVYMYMYIYIIYIIYILYIYTHTHTHTRTQNSPEIFPLSSESNVSSCFAGSSRGLKIKVHSTITTQICTLTILCHMFCYTRTEYNILHINVHQSNKKKNGIHLQVTPASKFQIFISHTHVKKKVNK